MLGVYMLPDVAFHRKCLFVGRKPQIVWHPSFLVTERGLWEKVGVVWCWDADTFKDLHKCLGLQAFTKFLSSGP